MGEQIDPNAGTRRMGEQIDPNAGTRHMEEEELMCSANDPKAEEGVGECTFAAPLSPPPRKGTSRGTSPKHPSSGSSDRGGMLSHTAGRG
eukprot:2714511-Pyramimonas_sp.AAC.1